MQSMNNTRIKPGYPQVLGAYKLEGGYNFAVEAPEDAQVSLLLYKRNQLAPVEEIPMGREYRTGRVFAIRLTDKSVASCQYNFLINGSVVQDPCACRLTGRRKFGSPYTEDPHAVRCKLLKDTPYDWEGDEGIQREYKDMILYKLHVRGYTKAAGSTIKKKGTFQGLTEMIPYWKDLGINTIELMPAYEFQEVADKKEQEGMITSRRKKDEVNFWGYIPGSYFAPKEAYCAGRDPVQEFKDMVKALHKAGIGCIMEMFFPRDISPLIPLHALQFWKEYYHVDGFHLLGDGVPLELLLRDGLLAGTMIMTQGYDMNEFYRGRKFVHRSFAEYNPGFLQDMRRFLKSDEDMVSAARYRLSRNPDTYGVINYMASQDGFTMNDMVSYNYRHNEANAEDNSDGCAYNYSWNCGMEGPSRKTAIRQLRERQIRNAFAMVLLAQGTPLIYGGDEICNSQEGNNNAYCQDNSIGWVDWKGQKRNQGIHTFVKKLIRFRMEHPILHGATQLRESDYLAMGLPDMSFHGERAWFCSSENTSRMLGILYCGAYAGDQTADENIYIGYNFYWEKRSLALPDLPDTMQWKKVLDTWDLTGDGFYEKENAREYTKSVEIQPRSIVVLLGERLPVPSKRKKKIRDTKNAGQEVKHASVASLQNNHKA